MGECINVYSYYCMYRYCRSEYHYFRIPYVFPVIKTLLLFITIIIVCVVTSLLVFSKSKSETIIELLRKDEV